MVAFFRRNPLRGSVQKFYVELAAAARNPYFFTVCHVADTLEGRFEVLVLHVALVQLRYKALAGEAEKAAQLLTDCLFADLDAAIREAGVSDVGVPRKMKMLAEAYFGRMAAYGAVLKGERDMTSTLARNVIATADTVPEHQGAVVLSTYVTTLTELLAQRDLPAILALPREKMLALTQGLADAVPQ